MGTLKTEIYFSCKEMNEKNNILKMFFHSPKPSPQEMALTSSNSKDIIKYHHLNLTSHSLVEKPSSFAGSSIRFEKDSSIFFKKLKLNLEQDKQIISAIISSNKKIPATKTDWRIAQTEFQKNNNSNNNNNNNNKVIHHNQTQKKNHQMM